MASLLDGIHGLKRVNRTKKSSYKHKMASMMCICAGLVVDESENVENTSVFKTCLKESRGAEDANKTN